MRHQVHAVAVAGIILLTLATAACGRQAPAQQPLAPQASAQQTPAPPAPVISDVRFETELHASGAFRTLPPGGGTLRVEVAASGATRVRFLLAPTGTDARQMTEPLADDGDAGDGWSMVWTYPDEDIMARLIIVAEGPGGSAETDVGLYHEATSTLGRSLDPRAEGAVVASGRAVFAPRAGDGDGGIRAATRVLSNLPAYARVNGWIGSLLLLRDRAKERA